MSNEASWFKHDSNARHDIKIQYLRSVHGNSGYGIFWMIVEIMRDSQNYKIKYGDIKTNVALARETDMPFNDIQKFIDFCIEAELFETDGDYFWSKSLLKRLDKFEERKRQNHINGTKGGRPRKEQIETHTEDVLTNIIEEDKPIKEKRTTSENATVAHYSSDVEYLTDLLATKIKENNLNAKIPAKLDAWKKDINAMIELDKYRFEQVARIIEFCQHDDFWKSNILSAKKLREKAGTLILQMQRSKPKEKKSESPQEMFDRLTRLMEERDNNEQKRNDSAIDVDAVFL